jgi:hypothetical protein
MSRTASELSTGPRITDYISLGVVASAFPRATIDEVLVALPVNIAIVWSSGTTLASGSGSAWPR